MNKHKKHEKGAKTQAELLKLAQNVSLSKLKAESENSFDIDAFDKIISNSSEEKQVSPTPSFNDLTTRAEKSTNFDIEKYF